ncbi:transposase [Crossiella sp. S99.2]|uniref:transposase n=1 Tax=unclassified Crossiella TaxID=2620835 RepID=UPI0035AB7797
MRGLGEQLNTVRKSAGPCPRCGLRESFTVHTHAVVWQCGLVRWLPPLKSPHEELTGACLLTREHRLGVTMLSRSKVIHTLVPDELWQQIQPRLPERPLRRDRNPGRIPIDDRAVLAGIVYVLSLRIPWKALPNEAVGCSGVTCWRRLREWKRAGVWPEVRELVDHRLRVLAARDLRIAISPSPPIRR